MTAGPSPQNETGPHIKASLHDRLYYNPFLMKFKLFVKISRFAPPGFSLFLFPFQVLAMGETHPQLRRLSDMSTLAALSAAALSTHLALVAIRAFFFFL